MFSRKILVDFSKHYKSSVKQIMWRNVHVCVVGAASDVGSYLSALLKKNPDIMGLKLFDYHSKVRGISLELNQLPGGPIVDAFVGETRLGDAVSDCNLIVMVSRTPRKPGEGRWQVLQPNAFIVERLCKAIAERNPGAFLAISTSPINSIIPFASAMLYRYNSYNPYKLFGITHIDTARTRSYSANALKANPRHLYVPVIGGHSDETLVPLFSNLLPNFYVLSEHQADCLTRLVRRAGTEVLTQKKGIESATIAMAWSINEFVERIVDALHGNEVEVNTFTANTNFGTRFFFGPTTVGPYGIIRTCSGYNMSSMECKLLSQAVPIINNDVGKGEEMTRLFD